METNGTKNGNQNGEVSYPSSDENGVDENHENHLIINRDLDHDHVNDFEEDHEEIFAQDQDVELTLFDETIGCIEDIVIEKQFQDLQESFLESNYHHFEIGTEENKLIYTTIFEDYTKAVEEFIEKELEQRIDNFSMKDFIKELEERKLDLDGEVFEMLFTLTDFLAFKEMFVDYKITRESATLNGILSVTSL